MKKILNWKTLLLAFVIGFIIAFCITYFELI